jgi:hypothetical protein
LNNAVEAAKERLSGPNARRWDKVKGSDELDIPLATWYYSMSRRDRQTALKLASLQAHDDGVAVYSLDNTEARALVGAIKGLQLPVPVAPGMVIAFARPSLAMSVKDSTGKAFALRLFAPLLL